MHLNIYYLGGKMADNNDVRVNKGNFEFIKPVYPDVYNFLIVAESEILRDYDMAGSSLRKAYEAFLKDLAAEYKIIPDTPKRPMANDFRKALKDANKLPIIPKQFYMQEYIATDGQKMKAPAYTVLQKVGNRSSHTEEVEKTDAKLCYENILIGLKIMHRILASEYQRKRGKTPDVFKAEIMPIGDNYVISSQIPADKAVSNCIMEYETCSYSDTGRIDKYSIIRVFAKNNMDEKLLQLRDAEAFSEAASDAGIQFDGNVQVDIISKMNSPHSDYYIVAYKFSKRPKRLNDNLLYGMSMEKRELLCKQIAKTLNRFHTLDIPIYHRNISFDCIYVCENKKGEIEPSIIKLDCAKIASEEFGTVIANVQNMQKMIQQQKLLKYIAPEARLQMQQGTRDVDWGKADVYSLGVLFADILNGQIEASIVPSAKLQRMGAKIQMIQLIDKMKNPNCDLRPDMQMVDLSFEEMD